MSYKDLKTINEVKVIDSTLVEYDYQSDLTENLDRLDSTFDQDTINDIVLWKVNRYVKLDKDTLRLINQIDKTSTTLDSKLTYVILKRLLDNSQRGIQLAMASTILRFKNPNLYQIIDQRVYRFIVGKILRCSHKPVEAQIDIYLKYLSKLKEVCNKYDVPYRDADRILYLEDKKYNSKIKLRY